MKEMRDSEIRLFGKKIALPENVRIFQLVTVEGENGDLIYQSSTGSDDSDLSLNGKKESKVEESEFVDEDEKEEVVEDEEEEEKLEADKECLAEDCCETKADGKDQVSIAEELEDSKSLSESDNSQDSPPPMDEDSPIKDSDDAENDENDANNSQQKKKPDKILPCPRCNSMDTKFCYYNNYNVNQPRHFCKSCQRYWTAGGTMRNVPVGAGRRKNKNTSSHCRHITISEALQAAQIDAPNGFHHPTFKPNGTVLSFGPDIPLCDSMASVLDLADKKETNGMRNGFYKVDPVRQVSCKGPENGDDCSSGSSVTTSNSLVEGNKKGQPEPVVQHINGFHSPIPCLPGVPWPFPWNSAVPVPAICPSAFPMPFYPAPYWNCGVAGVPGAWNIPWMPPVTPTAGQKPTNSGPNSPTLGKHSRDGELLNKTKSPNSKDSSETSVLVPKTLRIDDPDEAAKSSIWTTLGIKYDSVNKKGFFKAFQPKSLEKEHLATTSPVLQANPAALSRSVTFQEAA